MLKLERMARSIFSMELTPSINVSQASFSNTTNNRTLTSPGDSITGIDIFSSNFTNLITFS